MEKKKIIYTNLKPERGKLFCTNCGWEAEHCRKCNDAFNKKNIIICEYTQIDDNKEYRASDVEHYCVKHIGKEAKQGGPASEYYQGRFQPAPADLDLTPLKLFLENFRDLTDEERSLFVHIFTELYFPVEIKLADPTILKDIPGDTIKIDAEDFPEEKPIALYFCTNCNVERAHYTDGRCLQCGEEEKDELDKIKDKLSGENEKIPEYPAFRHLINCSKCGHSTYHYKYSNGKYYCFVCVVLKYIKKNPSPSGLKHCEVCKKETYHYLGWNGIDYYCYNCFIVWSAEQLKEAEKEQQ